MQETELVCNLPTFDHFGRGLVPSLVFVYKVMKRSLGCSRHSIMYTRVDPKHYLIGPVARESVGRDRGSRFRGICLRDYKYLKLNTNEQAEVVIRTRRG